MKLSFIYALLLAAAIVTPSAAQVSVYIGSAPPPLRIETRGSMPGPGYAWVEGYWVPNGRHYRWVQGRWDRPPYEGAHWNHAHYDQSKMRPAEREIDLKDRCVEYLAVGLDEDKSRANKQSQTIDNYQRLALAL